jgi:hypothetical protein
MIASPFMNSSLAIFLAVIALASQQAFATADF